MIQKIGAFWLNGDVIFRYNKLSMCESDCTFYMVYWKYKFKVVERPKIIGSWIISYVLPVVWKKFLSF